MADDLRPASDAAMPDTMEGLRRQNSAYRSLCASLEAQMAILTAKGREYQEAVTTLDSEREANAILTAENARLTEERDALVTTLRECEKVLTLVEKPAFHNPDSRERIEALGDEIGFGALMAGASAAWGDRLREMGVTGGEFVAGPCLGTVQKTLTDIRAALAKVKGGPDAR